MVTPLSVAVRIWAKSLSLIMLFGAIGCIVSGEIWGVLFVGLGLLFGFFITSPLLIVISPLVQWSSRMPYANISKMTWLIFFLAVFHQLIFTGICCLVQGNFNGLFSKGSALIFLSIIFVQFIAVITTRKRLYILYEEYKLSQE